MGRLLLALILAIALAPSAAIASDPPYWGTYNDGGSWQRYIGRGDVGTVTSPYQGNAGTARFVMGPGGIAKYDWTPVGNGVKATRSVPLTVKASAQNGLKRSVQVAVQDAITATPEALSVAGRVMVRNVLPVVGAGIIAYDVYKMLENDGIDWNDDQHTLVKDETIEYPFEHSYQVTRAAITNGTPASGTKPTVGTVVSGIAGLAALAGAWAPSGTSCASNGSLSYKWGEPVAIPGGGSGGSDTGRVQCKSTSGSVVANVYVDGADLGADCPDGFELSGNTCVQHHERPATDDEIEQAIEDEEPSELVKVPPELAAHNQNLPLPTDSPATYSVSPTTTNTPETTSTSTTHNPDGSTSTLTRHDSQTVTAQPQGDTLANSSVVTNVTNNYYITNENNETVEEHNEDTPPLPDPDVPDDQPDDTDQKQLCDDGACDFDAPDIPEAKTFAESLSGLYDAIKASPIASALGDLGALFPAGGACPTADFDALESHFVIDSHCTLMEMYKGVIQGVMLFVYFLCGVILFFKA